MFVVDRGGTVHADGLETTVGLGTTSDVLLTAAARSRRCILKVRGGGRGRVGLRIVGFISV